MSDLIDRQNAIDALKKIMFTHLFECGEYIGEDTREVSIMNAEKALDAIENLPSAEPEPERRWIPFTMREVTAEEKEVYPEWDSILDCKLPDDGEEILVSNGKYVWLDTFINDCDGCYLDGGDDVEGLAWQPLPEPWRGE